MRRFGLRCRVGLVAVAVLAASVAFGGPSGATGADSVVPPDEHGVAEQGVADQPVDPGSGVAAGTVLSGVMRWGAGGGGLSGVGYVGFARRRSTEGPDLSGGFELGFADGSVVRNRWDLLAVAQFQGVVPSGPAAGLSFPVVVTLSEGVDLSGGFVMYAGGHRFGSESAVNPLGDGSGFRYWMWDAPCVRWADGDESEFAVVASGPDGSLPGGLSDASLGSLSIVDAVLGGAFDAAVLGHAAVADAGIEQVTVDAAAAQPDACGVEISPPDADGDASNGHQVDLVGGETVVSVSVTSPDGSVVRVYTLAVGWAALSGDAALGGLAVAGAALEEEFDPAVLEYSARAAAHVARVTVAAVAADSGASVEVSPLDADGDASNGHQVDLLAARAAGGEASTTVEVSVTAADGVSRSVYSVAVRRTGASGFGRVAGRDVDLRGSGVAVPSGLWSDGSTVWMGDLVYDRSSQVPEAYRVAAVDAGSGALAAGGGLWLAGVLGAYGRATDVWSDGDTLWVLARDGRLVAFGLADAQRRAGSDIGSVRSSGSFFGLWSDGEVLWTGRNSPAGSSGAAPEVTVLAVDLSSGRRLAGRDIAVVSGLSGAAGKAHGLWSDGITMWVLFGDADAALAFDIASAQRRPSLDLGFFARDSISEPRALWSDGTLMWVGDYPTSYSLATDAFTGVSRLVAYYLPTQAALVSLSVADANGDQISIGAFNAWDTRYRASVPSGVGTVTVDAAAYHPDAAFEITPGDADPDTAGHQIRINAGDNTVTVLAGTPSHTVAYTIDIHRPPPTLTALGLTDTTLIPRLAPDTSHYNAIATVGTEHVTVTAASDDPAARVEITPADADPDADGHQIDVSSGDVTVTVTLTAADGVTARVYEVTVTRPPTPTLTALGLTDTTLTPRLAPDTSRYNAIATVGTEHVTVTAASDDPAARVEITPADADPDADGHQIDVSSGDVTVTVTLTAADGVTARVYEVTVTRPPPPALTALGLTHTTLTPRLAPDTSNYNAIATVGTEHVTVTAASDDPGARVDITPPDTDPDTDGHQIDLGVGDVTVTVTVTAADGVTARVYQVTVTRPPPPALTVLEASDTVLTPRPDISDSHYSGVAVVGTEQVTVTAVPDDPAATIEISPVDADADADGHQIDLEVGDNAVAVTVVAADGVTVRVYEVSVTRPPPPTLAVLELTDTTHTLPLQPDVGHYTAAVADGVERVTVTAVTDDAGATVEIAPDDADADSEGHQVAVGSSDAAVTVTVTAADGVTTRVYTVAIGRAVRPASAGRVALSGVDVEFSPTQSRYDTVVPRFVTSTSVELTPAGDSTLRGFTFTAGDTQVAPIGDDGSVTLTAGRDTLIAVRAASPGHLRERLYTFRLQTPPNNSNGARSDEILGARSIPTFSAKNAPQNTRNGTTPQLTALDVSAGTLVPAFAAAIYAYDLSVPFGTDHLTVTPTKPDDATVTYDSADADPDTALHQFALNPAQGGQSTETAVMVIVSQGGSSNSYTITVTREPRSTSEQSGTNFPGDNTTTGRIGIDDFLKGEISTAGDVDWYSIDLKADTEYFFYMLGDRGDVYDSTGTLREAWITGIYKSDGTQAATPWNPHDRCKWLYHDNPYFLPLLHYVSQGHRLVRCGTSFWDSSETMVHFVPETDGTYYVGVASDSASNTGTYTLVQRERDTAAGAVFFDSQGTLLSIANAEVRLGEPKSGFLEFPQERDRFMVKLTAGHRYRIVGSRASDVTGRSLEIEPGWPNYSTPVEEVLGWWSTYWRCRPQHNRIRSASITIGVYGRVFANNSGALEFDHSGRGCNAFVFTDFTAPVDGDYLFDVSAYKNDGADGWGGYKVTVTDITGN